MRITKQALQAFNANKVVTFNDEYNRQQKLGSKAENDALYRIGAGKWGICRDGQKLTQKDIVAAGHTCI